MGETVLELANGVGRPIILVNGRRAVLVTGHVPLQTVDNDFVRVVHASGFNVRVDKVPERSVSGRCSNQLLQMKKSRGHNGNDQGQGGVAMPNLSKFLRNRKKYVTGRYWRTTDGVFEFPENKLQSLKAKESLGVAFSGGGTRSAAATLGQLRALDALGIINKVRYISAVSGGTWAAAPYTYLPQQIRHLLSQGEFSRFPHFKTFFENPPKIIDLSKKQVGLLAHLSCWNIMSEKIFLEF